MKIKNIYITTESTGEFYRAKILIDGIEHIPPFAYKDNVTAFRLALQHAVNLID